MKAFACVGIVHFCKPYRWYDLDLDLDFGLFFKMDSWVWMFPILRLHLVRVKVFLENILFFGKENVFMCLVTFQKMFRKIFSGVWLCF